ncbi:glycosyltransferase family 4 protein [Photobacterium halotolerans]|uniref:Glycosyl transferase n=1 Tax=Photobacterium halotolerans TaxID=265726 RepID=A0A0F5VDP8_9GAMM|nr:glycosyltransferase family 4 protein [Photobacterium halotolerans]KKD00193.1 glycosyl transferase [Photobacterium halotolerans]
MHICHVNLATGFSGGEQQTLQLIKEQIRLGYTLSVVANPKSPFAQKAASLGCRMYLTQHFLFNHSAEITRQCQVIHVHEGRAIYWAWIQSKRFGCPYIVTRRIDNPLKDRWLLKKCYTDASATIGLSTAIVDCIHTKVPSQHPYKIPSSPVIYPVSDSQVSTIRTKFAGKFLVIHAGNLLHHKGFDVTIEAARLLEQQASNIHIAILGDGKLRAELESQAQGLTNISFMGKQLNMGDWFEAADLQIHPSYTEGLGSVILEGMKAGLPVVATRAGGIPDIIDHGINGELIPVGSSKQLAEAIARISQDSNLQKQYISAGQEKMNLFDISHTAKQYEAIYNSL